MPILLSAAHNDTQFRQSKYLTPMKLRSSMRQEQGWPNSFSKRYVNGEQDPLQISPIMEVDIHYMTAV